MTHPATMNAQLLDGKALAAKTRTRLKLQVDERIAAGLDRPGLATVLVGDDPASHVYVKFKRRACEEVGFNNFHLELPAATSQEELLTTIAELNANPEVHGILVQLPLPEHLDTNLVLAAVAPGKDADGFHPRNQGALMQGQAGMRPCTPLGVMRLIEQSGIDLCGKHAVVVGRSNIVGKPVALMLLEKHATVTVCHSRTADLASVIASADVLVAAVGRAHLVKGAWIKLGAVVIDVGINRLEDGSLTGDVEFELASKRAGWITPVPGGVGPMTIAMLLSNTLAGAEASS